MIKKMIFLRLVTWLLLCTAAFTLISGNVLSKLLLLNRQDQDQEKENRLEKMQKSIFILILIYSYSREEKQTREDAEVHEQAKTSTLNSSAGTSQFWVLTLKVQKRLERVNTQLWCSKMDHVHLFMNEEGYRMVSPDRKLLPPQGRRLHPPHHRGKGNL